MSWIKVAPNGDDALRWVHGGPWVNKLVKLRDSGLASVRDVRELLACGVEPDIARSLTASSAQTAIRAIQQAKALALATQGELF